MQAALRDDVTPRGSAEGASSPQLPRGWSQCRALPTRQGYWTGSTPLFPLRTVGQERFGDDYWPPDLFRKQTLPLSVETPLHPLGSVWNRGGW